MMHDALKDPTVADKFTIVTRTFLNLAEKDHNVVHRIRALIVLNMFLGLQNKVLEAIPCLHEMRQLYVMEEHNASTIAFYGADRTVVNHCVLALNIGLTGDWRNAHKNCDLAEVEMFKTDSLVTATFCVHHLAVAWSFIGEYERAAQVLQHFIDFDTRNQSTSTAFYRSVSPYIFKVYEIISILKAEKVDIYKILRLWKQKSVDESEIAIPSDIWEPLNPSVRSSLIEESKGTIEASGMAAFIWFSVFSRSIDGLKAELCFLYAVAVFTAPTVPRPDTDSKTILHSLSLTAEYIEAGLVFVERAMYNGDVTKGVQSTYVSDMAHNLCTKAKLLVLQVLVANFGHTNRSPRSLTGVVSPAQSRNFSPSASNNSPSTEDSQDSPIARASICLRECVRLGAELQLVGVSVMGIITMLRLGVNEKFGRDVLALVDEETARLALGIFDLSLEKKSY